MSELKSMLQVARGDVARLKDELKWAQDEATQVSLHLPPLDGKDLLRLCCCLGLVSCLRCITDAAAASLYRVLPPWIQCLFWHTCHSPDYQTLEG